jgi:hypothetical protein
MFLIRRLTAGSDRNARSAPRVKLLASATFTNSLRSIRSKYVEFESRFIRTVSTNDCAESPHGSAYYNLSGEVSRLVSTETSSNLSKLRAISAI